MKAAGLGVERGHGARAVDADQPVRLGTADGGVGQRLHRGAGAQRGKAVADRPGRHGLQPEALDGLFGFRVLDDVAENQLALPARVAGVDQPVHVLALEEPGQNLEPGLAFLDGLEGEMRGDAGQVGKGPLAALDLEFLGHANLEEVADGGRKDEFVTFKVFVVFGEAAERLGDVAGDGRFFRDDKRFSHAMAGVLQRTAAL